MAFLMENGAPGWSVETASRGSPIRLLLLLLGSFLDIYSKMKELRGLTGIMLWEGPVAPGFHAGRGIGGHEKNWAGCSEGPDWRGGSPMGGSVEKRVGVMSCLG